MKIPFYKYQGAGNDFVLIDQRERQYLQADDTVRIRRLCDRRFGVGADGLMFLQLKEGYDFEMVYFNADGREGSMCGNGGRCIVAFAQFLGLIQDRCRFWAVDGEHEAWIRKPGWVELLMQDVPTVERGERYYFMDTGSPHYIRFVDDVKSLDVVAEGRKVRYADRYRREGTNVNFVQIQDKGIKVATYERGVEDETLACGTGVTAAAIAYSLQNPQSGSLDVPIEAKGGRLNVRFEANDGQFKNIWLCGPAEQIFSGIVGLG